jgi:transposase
VRKGEERILDRPMRAPGDTGGSVNKKLQAYLEAHPEIVPPEPVRLPPKDKKPPTERPIDPPPSRN